MKFIAISDTHCAEVPIPDGDVLLHAGDFTYRGNHPEVFEAARWMKSLPHKSKIAVAGNHDRMAEKESGRFADMMQEAGVHYLFDSGVVISPEGKVSPWSPAGPEQPGIKIHGSPWQPEFCNWAFNLPRGAQLKEKWDLIPDSTDILITHGPAYGILDRAPRDGWEYGMSDEDLEMYSEKVGCWDMLQAIKRVKPKVHLFGHIHADYGVREVGGTKHINASIMDERYDPVNKPVEFEL